MKSLVFLSCVVALAVAEPGLLAGHAIAPVAASVSSQYHAQDELGQYSYGYAGGPSAKQEVRTADGITRGGYSYIDGNGLVQSASYVSDPVNGFRVAATNLPVGPGAPAAPVAVAAAPAVTVNAAIHAPVAYAAAPVAYAAAPAHFAAPVGVVDTPEVTAAKIAHFNAHAEAKARLLGRKKRGILGSVAAPAVATYSAPAAVAVAPARSFAYSTVSAHAAPVAVAAPAVATYSAPAAVAVAPARSFAYSTVSAHAAPVAVAAPAVATYAAPAAVAAPAVAVAPARSFAYSTVSAHAAPVAVAAPAVAVAPARSFAYSTVSAHATPVAYAAPAVTAHAVSAPAVVAAPAVATRTVLAAPAVAAVGSSQYRSQDELGQYSYGYADGNSVKHETRALDGSVAGIYSYVDGNGIVQTSKYHADALGFRVAATNIPVGPA